MNLPPRPAMAEAMMGRKTIAVYKDQPFIKFTSSTAMVPRLRK
jgi:hypothetical protein